MITYPLNNIDYTAEDAELYFSTRESGVYDGNHFEVTVSGIDNDVTVDTGIAWIHNTKFSGKVVALKELKTLTLSLPNSVYDRIDAIVIQFDANKNATDIIVKEGIASFAPIAPTVVRTESLYELHIFHVQRKAGATVISVENLVDLRNDSNYCGIMFDSISSIDPTLTKSGYAADAAETGKKIKRATNVRNLLDNSDFSVNQRGATEYSGASVYSVDRWKIGNTVIVGKVVLGENGVTLSSDEDYCDFFQNLEHYAEMKGKKYTIAYMDGDGNIYASPFTMGAHGGSQTWIDFGKVKFMSLDTMNILFRVYETETIQWAALYEGEYTAETLPEYQPKEAVVDLMACLVYYHLYATAAERPSNGLDCSPPMRIAAVTQGTIKIDGTTYYYNSADL